ncbi:hypothetical protein HMPREF1317_0987 [Schaalia georgiae F0490]|uniref:Uncharacterized protein n=1 Tax=Schaalia georgiae F0490 TaxID=1125717 RepID=J1HJW6_9ACTO|nr:hypothetical protein HMPREF1317_0987 [Schaalia georgiae F0490]
MTLVIRVPRQQLGIPVPEAVGDGAGGGRVPRPTTPSTGSRRWA